MITNGDFMVKGYRRASKIKDESDLPVLMRKKRAKGKSKAPKIKLPIVIHNPMAHEIAPQTTKQTIASQTPTMELPSNGTIQSIKETKSKTLSKADIYKLLEDLPMYSDDGHRLRETIAILSILSYTVADIKKLISSKILPLK